MMWRTAVVRVLRPASAQLQFALDHAVPGHDGVDVQPHAAYPPTVVSAGELQQLLVAGRSGGNGHLLDHRAANCLNDRRGVAVLVGVDPDDELDASRPLPPFAVRIITEPRAVSQSFHQPLLGPTGAHSLDDPPDTSRKDSTRQYAVDDPLLSCQQVGGSSPPASSWLDLHKRPW
jgi:hypothetical protein